MALCLHSPVVISFYVSYHRRKNDILSIWIRSLMVVALVSVTYALEQLSPTETSSLQANSAPVSSLSVNQVDQGIAKTHLKNGDIVFRAQSNLMTDIAAPLNAEVNYSHAGIIVIEGDQLKVVYGVLDASLNNRVIEETLTEYLQKEDTAQAAIYRLKNSHSQLQNKLATTAIKLFESESNNKTEPSQSQANPVNRRANAAETQGFETEGFETEGFIPPSTNENIPEENTPEKNTPAENTQIENAANRLLTLTTAERMSCSAFILKVYEQAGVALEAPTTQNFSLPFSGACISPDELAESYQLEPVYQFEPQRAVHSTLLP